MTRRIYKNPPIEEALCQFHFDPASEWDPTTPLLFREKIKSAYPGLPRQKAPLEADIHAGPEAAGASFLLKQDASRMQFPSDDGTKLVAIGQNMMSAHALRPYQGWEGFRSQISQALDAYLSTVDTNGIRRIGLRYINKIEVDIEGTITLIDYFSVPPQSPAGFPSRMVKFLTHTELIYDDEPIILILNFTDLNATEGKAAFLLDLDMVWEWADGPIPAQDALEKVDILREREREAFELLITDKAREIFDA